jgi:lysophospholipase
MRDEVWRLDESFSAPKRDNPSLFQSILVSLVQNMAAGFKVNINDVVGRRLAYHLVNDTRRVEEVNQVGSATLWSSIQEQADFQSGVVPFPIALAVGRQQGQINVTIASPLYEFTPYEFGSSFPGISPGAFIPMENLATRMIDGVPVDQENCVTGFDNAA